MRIPVLVFRSSTIVLLLLIVAAAGAERTWTDTQGRTFRGEFVREVDGEVTLLADGKLITIPLDQLSERDRQLAKDLAAGKPLPDERIQPSVPAPAPAPTDKAGEEKVPKALQKQIAIVNRVWTDIHGNQTTAKFVRMFGSNVVLARASRTVTVPFYELSSDDQQYLKDLLTSQGKESEIPPPPQSAQGGQPGAAAAPSPQAAPNAPPAVLGGGGASTSFDEMQKRGQKQREEMRQQLQEQQQGAQEKGAAAGQRLRDQAAEMRQPAAEGSGTQAFSSATRQAGVESATAPGAATEAAQPTPGIFDGLSTETKQAIFIAFVVIGALGVIAVVVFVAFSLASANTVSRQRRYF